MYPPNGEQQFHFFNVKIIPKKGKKTENTIKILENKKLLLLSFIRRIADIKQNR